MAESYWAVGARAISQTMRRDIVEIFKSVAVPNSIGEWSDDLTSIGQYNANVTTPTESIDEDVAGTLRTHLYQITLGPEVQLPRDAKIFVKLIKTRQGDTGALLEVTDLSGGLLGQTLSAADERN